VGTILISVFLIVMYFLRGKGTHAYLLIVRHDFDCANEVAHAMRRLPRGSRLKSKTVTQNGVEVTMEVRLPGEDMALVNDFLRINGVYDATLISYDGDYGA